MRISLRTFSFLFFILAGMFLAIPLTASAAGVVYLTEGSTWTVPADWDSSRNTIEVIGGGAGGGPSTWWSSGGGGGGGGGYSRATNVVLTPGSIVSYVIGSGGGSGVRGSDTFFCNGNCSNITDSTVVAAAKGGTTGGNGFWGFGGKAAEGIGTIRCTGGDGAQAGLHGGGGGGAAGPNGSGAFTKYAESLAGGAGDAGAGGVGGVFRAGGKNGGEWGNAGSGGGGGAGAYPTGSGAAGGKYGAGGGGGGEAAITWGQFYAAGGPGASGIIVITYGQNPIPAPAVNCIKPETQPSCSVTVDRNPIKLGETAKLHYTSSNAVRMYINYVGDVPPNTSGSPEIGPFTNDANLSATVTSKEGVTVECPLVLRMDAGNQCRADLSCRGNSVFNSCTNQETPCPSGTTCRNGQCVGRECVPTFSCLGNAVFNSCTKATTPCLATQQCVSGQCRASFIPFPGSSEDGSLFNATGHLEARPILVRQGSASRLFWNASSFLSCAVTGGNGDSWAMSTSGAAGQETSPLQGKTVFTLRCEYTEDPSRIITETATVNVVPLFNEI